MKLPYTVFFLGLISSVSYSSVFSPAVAQENAACQVVLEGASFIDGRCTASRDEFGSLILASMKVDQSSGMPLSRFQIEFNETGDQIEFVRYNQLEMPRFADLSLTGMTGSMTDNGGCIESATFKACFIPDAESAQTLSPKDIFEAASENDRLSAQSILKEYGYYLGEVDGAWGLGTEQAMNSLAEVSHAFSLVDQNAYRLNFDEQGMRQFLADIEAQRELPIVYVYSYCDNLDGYLLDVEQKQGKKMGDLVAQVYVPVAEKWCPMLFVEGE